MIWFEDQNGNTLCMEVISVGDVQIQALFDPGFYQYRLRRTSKRHVHQRHELYFAERNTCQAWCGGTDYTLKEHDMLLIPAEIMHNVMALPEDSSLYSFKFSIFHTKAVNGGGEIYQSLTKFMERPILLHASLSTADALVQIRAELACKKFLFADMIQDLLSVFYINLFRQLMGIGKIDTRDHNFSIGMDAQNSDCLHGFQKSIPEEYTIDIMDNFFTEFSYDKPTLGNLSKILHLSTRQTERLVKKIYGISFNEKLTKSRIEQSMWLISKGIYSIEEVSELVGYGSYHAFYDAFTRQTGQTPSQYKRSLEGRK